MKARGFWSLNGMSDRELEGSLLSLLAAGGRTDARIVAHLAEIDARRLHLLGGRSLFEYCLVRLGLSESEAYYRICAARAGRAFPVVFELLERRELHLTTIALIGKHLTEANHVCVAAMLRRTGSAAGRARFWSWTTGRPGRKGARSRSITCGYCAGLTID